MPEIFIDDEQGYLGWLARHPEGFVVNTNRTPNSTYLKLHRSSCGTISGIPARGDRWTTGDYAKVCSDQRAALDVWARTTVGGVLNPCGLCRP